MRAQTCTGTRAACGAHYSGRLENTSCHFSDGYPVVYYYYDAVSGTSLDIFLSSDAFQPLLALYRGDEQSPIVVSKPLITITELKFDVLTSGRYWIAATSNNRITSGLFTLDFYCSSVCHEPFITAYSPAATVKQGQTATLFVTADGTPPLHYSWYDVSAPSVRIGGDSPTVVVSPLQSTAYGVTISNACKSINAFIGGVTVIPCVAPTITGQPQGATIQVGGAVTMTVTASGDTPLRYQWYEGRPPDVTRPFVCSTATCGLINPSTNTYWVRVSNSCGSTDSQPATILVQQPTQPSRRRTARH
jgi:hypothetical protein